MTITKRTLERWRKEALCDQNPSVTLTGNSINVSILIDRTKQLSERILRLTQVLLDQHLIRRKS